MNALAISHIISPGQKLNVRWREARDIVLKNIEAMKLSVDFGGNPYADVWVTYIDEVGVSLYIVRGYTYGGDMEAFLPAGDVMWQSYFSPEPEVNQAYVKSGHYTKVFPVDFL